MIDQSSAHKYYIYTHTSTCFTTFYNHGFGRKEGAMSHDAACFSEMGNQRSREPSNICPWEIMAVESVAHLPPQLLEDYVRATISRSSIWFIQMFIQISAHRPGTTMIETSTLPLTWHNIASVTWLNHKFLQSQTPSCPTEASKKKRYDQLGCGLSTLDSSSERIVDDLPSNVDDFLDVMMFLKQSLGEATGPEPVNDGCVVGGSWPLGGVEWNLACPYVMTFPASMRFHRFGVRIGYSTHCVLTLCTIKGFV